MRYPKFFDEIETIKLKDELSAILGSVENGEVEFSYLDIVKSAGHSCPTVAGAYLMTQVALKELYKNETPKRGEIFVSFKEDSKDGVAGVIANVISQITGATETLGFKGLNGRFTRYGLMKFNDKITTNVKFTRVDTKESVEIIYNPTLIEPDKKIQEIMQKLMQNKATNDEKIEFGKLWQDRVEKIFNNKNRVIKIL